MKKPADFFLEARPHSKVKSEIVSKYFAAWLGIVGRQSGNLTYLDLFSGRGEYVDETPATPLRILDAVEANPQFHHRLELHFYEKNKDLCDHLRKLVEHHPVYAALRTKPTVNRNEVNRDLIESLPIDNRTLSFIDPCGYQDLSEDLLAAVIKRWGSDCIFYLCTSGIRRNIEKNEQRPHMIELFGESELPSLRNRLLQSNSTDLKDKLMLSAIETNLNRHHNVYMLSFAMEFEKRQSKSHYLVSLCKHPKGFELMKDIVARYSCTDALDIPLWVFSNLRNQMKDQQGLCLDDGLRRLKRQVLKDFEGESILVKDLVDQCHSLKYLYLEKNIKAALLSLEDSGDVLIDKPREQRPVRMGQPTLSGKHLVTFNSPTE